MFMVNVQELLDNESQEPDIRSRIMNFDRTSVARLKMRKRTIDVKGEKQILATNPPCTKENFTVGLAVRADGTKEKAIVETLSLQPEI